MFNGGGFGKGVFEHEVNGYKGIVATRLVWDHYELDKKLGLVGGGGFDFRFDSTPINFAFGGPAAEVAALGQRVQGACSRTTTTRTVFCYGHTTSLPVETNSISLDPTVKDDWGVPAIRMTYQDHPQDLKLYKFFAERAEELLKAAGAVQTWQPEIPEPGVQRPPARHVPNGERPEDSRSSTSSIGRTT